MSAVTQGGTLSFSAGSVRFENAADLLMPFSGSVVVPRAPTDTLAITALSAEDSVQYPLLRPGAGVDGARRFTSLRTKSGAVLATSGSVIVLVAQDSTAFGDIDLGAIFGPGSVLTPQLPDGVITSSRPKYIVITVDGDPNLGTPLPASIDAGTTVRSVVSALTPQVSGTMRTFDISGMEVEPDAALVVVDGGTPTGAPTNLRVQLVDIWGRPMAPTDLPAQALKFDPPITGVDANHMGTMQFTGSTRTVNVTQAQPDLNAIAESDRHLHRHVRIAVWPGNDFELRDIDGTGTTFEIDEGVPSSGTAPDFLRLCVFHPTQTMQDDVGGGVDQDGVFTRSTPATPANGFHLCAPGNNVEVFNDGLAYFEDFRREVGAAQPGDQLFLCNWVASAHLHLRGSLEAYDVGPVDVDSTVIDLTLNTVDQHRLIVPIGTDKKKFLLVADRFDRGDAVPATFHVESHSMPTATSPAKKAGAGFVRSGERYAVVLGGDGTAPVAHHLTARWKNVLGDVLSTAKVLSTLPAALNRAVFPPGLVSLGVDAHDPPRATLTRVLPYTDLLAQLGEPSASILRLLVFNVTAGTSEVIELNQGSPTATNVVLGTLPEMTTAQDVIVAAVLSDVPTVSQNLADVLVTSFETLAYDPVQHSTGEIPLTPEEFGGLIRAAVSRGVIVRAMFWEQFLANMSVDADLLAGHSNNVEMAAVINRSVAGRRGFAVLDRATRPFGSFHQKSTVLVRARDARKDVIAWVGGVDLALGRWDTGAHHSSDPDRQGSAWWDVHVKMTGGAALDVLGNFRHRWSALGHFIANAGVFADAVPRNPSPPIATNTQTPIVAPTAPQLHPITEPDSFVQITRTFPPRSPYAQLPTTLSFTGDGGELGSLAAYLHAIGSARRFILINDQYFFNTELALALHQALTRDGGPEFVVLMLPKDLAENPYVDPMLFKTRQKALHVLFHGGTFSPPSGAPAPPGLGVPRCGRITANAPSASSVVDKVAVLFARNREGKPVYVHSKQMIVDDVWMSIGSSNMNFRSMSYDCEINASVVGRSLVRGGTGTVRSQRIDLASRMLGLPAAYAPMLQDPMAMFAHLKALEAAGSSPANSLHPLAPMTQQLDPTYVKRVTGDAAFDSEVDLVIGLPVNDPVITGIACSVLDADGRSPSEPLAPLLSLAGMGSNPINAYARVTATVGCQAMTNAAIGSGTDLFAELRVTRTITQPDGAPLTSGPHRTHLHALGIVSGTVQLVSPPEFVIALSVDHLVTIEARIVDATDAPIGCSGTTTIDPNSETVLPGSFRNLTIEMT